MTTYLIGVKKNMGLIIGLTGGIASGKSTVASFLETQNIPIIDTDQLGRELVEPNRPALKAITDAFGQTILQPNGQLDRAALRTKIFSNAASRKTLEAILHPAIRELAQHRALEAAAQSPYVLVVVPLLAEPEVYPNYRWLNRVIGIRATPNLQQHRLMRRPGMNAERADQMLAAQSTDELRATIVDDWLDNTGDLAQLEEQTMRLHQRLLAACRT
ncbi:MAG: dephospho-CoA kinase [Halothiobacillus sp.]